MLVIYYIHHLRDGVGGVFLSGIISEKKGVR